METAEIKHKAKKWVITIIVIFIVLFAIAFFSSLYKYVTQGVDSTALPKGFSLGIASNPNTKADYTSKKIAFSDYFAPGRPTFGTEGAPLTIVEFGDFQCPYSKQAFTYIRRFVAENPGKVFFEYRDFPLSSIHERASEYAEAGKCANEQNKFWEFHDKMFLEADQDNIDVKAVAQSAGLEIEKFSECMDSHRFLEAIKEDADKAYELGLRGTPTFLINGFIVEGALSDSFWNQLTELYEVK